MSSSSLTPDRFQVVICRGVRAVGVASLTVGGNTFIIRESDSAGHGCDLVAHSSGHVQPQPTINGLTVAPGTECGHRVPRELHRIERELPRTLPCPSTGGSGGHYPDRDRDLFRGRTRSATRRGVGHGHGNDPGRVPGGREPGPDRVLVPRVPDQAEIGTRAVSPPYALGARAHVRVALYRLTGTVDVTPGAAKARHLSSAKGQRSRTGFYPASPTPSIPVLSRWVRSGRDRFHGTLSRTCTFRSSARPGME